MLITGEGSVDFRDERYDALLRAKSKQMSLLALRGPIVVQGTFKQPVVRPAIGPVAARVGAAIGLGAIAPPLALLPLIDFGGAPDVDCRNLMEEARVEIRNLRRDAADQLKKLQRDGEVGADEEHKLLDKVKTLVR